MIHIQLILLSPVFSKLGQTKIDCLTDFLMSLYTLNITNLTGFTVRHTSPKNISSIMRVEQKQQSVLTEFLSVFYKVLWYSKWNCLAILEKWCSNMISFRFKNYMNFLSRRISFIIYMDWSHLACCLYFLFAYQQQLWTKILTTCCHSA